MATRRVRCTPKDKDGDITALGHAGQWWSPRSVADVIADIEAGTHEYYVQEESPRADVSVVNGTNGKYLRTDADSSSKNNLDNLPDC